jgi:hypothetical protein
MLARPEAAIDGNVRRSLEFARYLKTFRFRITPWRAVSRGWPRLEPGDTTDQVLSQKHAPGPRL